MQLTLAIEVQVTIVTIISMIYLLFLQTRHGIRYFLPPHDVFSSVAATAKSLQSWPTLCNPIDGSPPGSPVPGILQARTLEWVAMSFSKGWKWKVKGKSLSRVRLLATTWTAAPPGSSVHGILQARVLEWGATAFSSVFIYVLQIGNRHVSS